MVTLADILYGPNVSPSQKARKERERLRTGTAWHPPLAIPKAPVRSSTPKITRQSVSLPAPQAPVARATTGGGYDPAAAAAAAQAKANATARAASEKQNDATRKAAEAKAALLPEFEKQRDSKLRDITANLKASDSTLLANYETALGGLEGTREDNEMSEADQTFANILNTLRERGDIAAEVAAQGAGETDMLRAQLAALRNYDTNQNEINRSYFDTLRSVNRAVSSLNTDTITSRKNIYDQAESERASAYSNFYNQMADAWNEIFNIESQNTNVDSDTSVAYKTKYGDAAKKAAEFTGKNYERKAFDPALRKWEGQGSERTRSLSNNRASVINLGTPQRRPEGATLRRWQ